MNQSFDKPNDLKTTLISIIKRINTKYVVLEDTQFPDFLNFHILVREPDWNLEIAIIQRKNATYRIEMANTIRFSPEHAEVYKQLDLQKKFQLQNDLFFWLTPREPDFIFDDRIDEIVKVPYFVIVHPLYEGELNISNLMRKIKLIVKSSVIAKRLIQNHLYPIMANMNMEEISAE